MLIEKMFLRIFIFCILSGFYNLNLEGQINNTTWFGELNSPYPMECYFNFRGDTASLSMVETGEEFELMLYRIDKDTLFITKLFGISPCSTELEGVYSFNIENDELSLKSLYDQCSDRVASFPKKPMKFVENKNSIHKE